MGRFIKIKSSSGSDLILNINQISEIRLLKNKAYIMVVGDVEPITSVEGESVERLLKAIETEIIE